MTSRTTRQQTAFAAELTLAVTDFAKTQSKASIEKAGIMSVSMVDRLCKGTYRPKKLSRKIRALVEFLGYDPEAMWAGKRVRIARRIPPSPQEMLDKLLRTERATSIVDVLASIYRDEFSVGIDSEP